MNPSVRTLLLGCALGTFVACRAAAEQPAQVDDSEEQAVALSLLTYAYAQDPAQQGSTEQPLQKLPTTPRPASAADNRRHALQLLADAEAALETGQHARAASLAREAQRLYPESRAIAGFLAGLDSDSSAARGGISTHNRAKAHLAAALSRAQVLMQQRRYTEALDLLNGIVEAAGKLPPGTDAALYRDLAQKELIEYRVAVQTGKIRPSAETPMPRLEATAEQTAVAPSADFPPALSNAYRLARIAREQTPPWYARHKASLKRPMSVDYRSMPLRLVLDDIQETTGVPIIVDTPVQNAKTMLTAQVDLRVGTVPAETVLNLAVQVAGCDYVLLEKGVVITTTDKAGDYIRQLPDAVTHHWARMRHLFPDLFVEAMASRPLPEAKPHEAPTADDRAGSLPAYLRSGRDLISDIEHLVR